MKEFAELTRDLHSPSPLVRLATVEALAAILEYAIFDTGGIERYYEATILAGPHETEYSEATVDVLIRHMQSAASPSLRGLAAMALTEAPDERGLMAIAFAREHEGHPVVRCAQDTAIGDLLEIFQSIDQDLL